MKVKSESEVAQLCPTPSDLRGSSVHGICQARVLEWVAIAFSDLILELSNSRTCLLPIVQLIFDKYTEAVQQRKESIFSHDAEPIGHHKQKKELCLKLHLLCKN